MEHGVAGYFLERDRFERRVSLLTLAVGLVFLSSLGLARVPPVRRPLESVLMRFGFEGPTQYVRRITLGQYRGQSEVLSQIGRVNPVAAQRGGQRGPRRSDPRSIRPEFRPRLPGTGSAAHDVAARSTARVEGVPVVQSEDLIIDQLVRPEYPPALLEGNIEGNVMLQALIDTAGRVIDVQVMGGTGQPLFERAAVKAVLQCRFRPYRLAGMPSEVYAVFRFAFRIY